MRADAIDVTNAFAQIWPHRVFYLFVLPFAALTILFGVWPILLSIQISFTASATALRAAPSYVGFANYVAVFADPLFLASLIRTLVYTALAVVANLAFALAVATLLDSTLLKRANLFFRLAIFLPVVTPDVAGYVVWRWLFSLNFEAWWIAIPLVVAETYSLIDVMLQRRHDLIPQLAACVKAAGAHESEVLTNTTTLRSGAIAMADATNEATLQHDAIAPLIACAEGYPSLQADASFVRFQHSLSDTEDRIAAAREFYNDSATTLRTRSDAFPGILVNRFSDFTNRPLFAAQGFDRTVPHLNLATDS